MRKIIILKHSQGELANQLWNYASVYACGLESGARVRNPSFFEYHSYFNLLKSESVVTKFFSFWFRKSITRRSGLRNRFWRNVYLWYSGFIRFFVEENIISSENENNHVVYLPPTSALAGLDNKVVGYFTGWLFRNPVGLKKFRKELVSAFSPNKTIENKIASIIKPFRQKYDKIIGVHIRQTDYRTFKGGIYFIEQIRAREIMDEFIMKNNTDKDKVLFLITSDGPVDSSFFNDLNIYISKENSVTDLFLLSSTDTIIGSDSSFGAFASWYGNIPHIVMTKNSIDWSYYTDKKEYFENKFSKMVQY